MNKLTEKSSMPRMEEVCSRKMHVFLSPKSPTVNTVKLQMFTTFSFLQYKKHCLVAQIRAIISNDLTFNVRPSLQSLMNDFVFYLIFLYEKQGFSSFKGAIH